MDYCPSYDHPKFVEWIWRNTNPNVVEESSAEEEARARLRIANIQAWAFRSVTAICEEELDDISLGEDVLVSSVRNDRFRARMRAEKCRFLESQYDEMDLLSSMGLLRDNEACERAALSQQSALRSFDTHLLAAMDNFKIRKNPLFVNLRLQRRIGENLRHLSDPPHSIPSRVAANLTNRTEGGTSDCDKCPAEDFRTQKMTGKM
jgi:hypothetical protein